ncbi:CCR4-NOT transcription complex subunit 3 isoform X1 [Lucilia cuprina]|uniref:CCR4-NOT transcription complex subunit 3 isoform X1 n=1 Tax=Lucilia cuprina TaxID=7375 RepID=UPI001F06A27C|nr:CCR4-NOT transcription complex subunit 3 isoform X1 [Lucilia cuprina]XP_023296541.2 CCR4-NOT transcription complex subunit 3 isoform X1 [Lucilia cuprina]XP_023296543.2 CCR4-NOT transcription complex subunit 3 isoform X1 [Lucilia cuprina]
MAATRKLQGEIDRCLKKVAEGVETFEDIWKKVHNATNSNQKVIEKYEADLKKEIKKLQRLRDQIKSWIASAEIKDKSALLENRRLIETQMERFKIVERETKTKAYSKEGLGAAQKMDPAQRIKDEARNWLTNSISSLLIQIDQYESEIESLLAGKKKRLDRDKQDRMDELRSKLDRHKFHVTKLETLLRLLDNDNVEAEQVNKIKDDVEYYIDSSQEPDFEENEFIYDDIIGIDVDVEYSGTGVSLGIPSSATTDSNNSNETSGSPSSITSGGSPVQSPLPAQQQQMQQQASNTSGSGSATQQQQINLNYSSDSTAADGTAKDKHNKNESNANSKTKQPVKPTAVRANNKTSSGSTDVPTSKIISSTPSKNHHQPQTQHEHHPTQQQQQQQQQTAAAVVAAATASSAASGNHTSNNINTSGAPTLAAAVAAAAAAASTVTVHNNPAVQQHAPAPTLQGNPSIASVTASSANSNNNSTQQIQGQSVIQATPTIAFSAVAKHNTSHLENGPVHGGASYAIVGGSQQQQLSNLQANSSHLQNAHNTSNNSTVGSIANVVQQGANPANVNNLAASAVNCISPNGIAGLQQALNAQQQVLGMGANNNNNNNARASPGLLSPKHMNGLPVTSVANNTSSVDAISLKTMAQEAINRSVIDTNNLSQQQASSLDNRQQQQQQQVLQQHFSSDTTANTHQQQQQQQQTNTTAGLVAAVTASTNGPTTLGGNSAGNNGGNVGPIGSNINASALTNAAGQQPIGAGASSAGNKQQQQLSQQQQQPTNEAHIPPLLGVAPLGPSPLQKDHQLQFQMMEAAYYHLPTPSDSEKLTTYFHRTPVQTPAHYPQQQLPIYDTVEFYQRLSTETLFFVFYYMEGSKAQYLAAKALKKQSWRFHTKYMMWFQRHEEPKIINDDYEQGTYIYFDYEKWSQRKKEGFTFEYKYLEDKELN